MSTSQNEHLMTRRSMLGAAAAFAFGSAAFLSGCGSEKATVAKDDDSDASKESKDDSSTESKEEETTDLAVGTVINLTGGLSVVVDSVQTGLVNYDGCEITGIHVTYTNNGEDGADYNLYDWKGEDANGAQQSEGYYSEGQEELQSGTLAAGGTVAGNVYFEGHVVKALYFRTVIDKTAAASWVVQQ